MSGFSPDAVRDARPGLEHTPSDSSVFNNRAIEVESQNF